MKEDKSNIKKTKTKPTTNKPKPKNPNLNSKGKPKQKVGRKSKYETHVLPKFDLIEAWCRDGIIDEVIYKRLMISKDTFYEYKKKYPEFSGILKKGKEVVDVQVENALLKRALGFKETVRKPIKVKTAHYNNGKRAKEEESVIYAEEEFYYPPDTTSIIFWLINRSAGKWQNTQHKEVKIDPESNEMLKSITSQLLKAQTEKATENDIDSLED